MPDDTIPTESAGDKPDAKSSRRSPVGKVAAYEEFRSKLLNGDLHPGQFVTQSELADIAGVSVAAAREAIQKLEHQSILKVHPQRGIQIAEITLEFIRNAFGLRRMLECESVRHFARDASDKTLNDLHAETLNVLNLAKENPTEEIHDRAVDIDWQLHDDIIEHMNNQMISEIFQINALRLRLINATIRLTPDRVAGSLEEHLRILDCCIGRDPEGAALAMEHHINTAMTHSVSGV